MALALAAFHVALMAVAASIFVAAAVNDAYFYRIPNYMCALLLALFPIFVITAPHSIDWHQSLAVFGLVVLSGFAMFLSNMAGAGDIKLLSVASLWAGPHLIATLLVVTALVGGVESLFMVFLTHRRNQTRGEAAVLHKIPIPYGVAIASGGLATLGMMARPILWPN